MRERRHILERLHPRRQDEGEEYWLLSLSDLMALLLGFFVVLYAASAISEAKFEAITQSLQKVIAGRPKPPPPAVGRPSPIRPPLPQTAMANPASTGMGNGRSREDDYALILDLLHRSIDRQRLQSQVTVRPTARGVEMTAAGSLLFPSASAQLSPGAKPLIDLAVKTMERFPLTLIVEGHTDDLPIHSARYPSNWELSAARAARVVRELIERGIGSDRLSASGYADTRPLIHPEGTPLDEQRARNRRAVLVFALPK
ncbi:flagellar motor protein MotB [Endothiovibrio diazotrophicus]